MEDTSSTIEMKVSILPFTSRDQMESYLDLQRRKILSGRTSPNGQQAIAVREPSRIKDVTNHSAKVSELEDQVRNLSERLTAVERREAVLWQKDESSPRSHRRRSSGTSLPSRMANPEPTILEVEETPVQTLNMPNFPFHVGGGVDARKDENLTPKRLWAMWEQYRTSVDPILKLVHIPSVQHLFLSTEDEQKDVEAGAEALKYAICFAAAASLDQKPSEASSCATSRALLVTYSSRVETALTTSRFLAEPTIASVQALTIYLVCGQRHLDQTYIWSLTSILVRVAIKLKLNRDPETQGVSFLDAEYRRRLWWQICTLDARAAELNGTDPLIYERQCTARFPISMQDADVESIQADEIESKRNSQTHSPDMFCNMLRYEITYYARTVLFSDDFKEENGWPILPPEGKISVIEYLEKVLEEKYYRGCTCESPVCKLAIASSRIGVARLKLLAVLGEQGASELRREETDQVLNSAAIILENLRELREDPTLSRWTWLCQPHAEWNAAAMCLSVLVLGHWKSDAVVRAWNAITLFFIAWKESSYDPALYKRWVRLEGLKARVEKLQRPTDAAAATTTTTLTANRGSEDPASPSRSGYTAYSPNVSLSPASTTASKASSPLTPNADRSSQAGSLSSKSSGSVRSAFSDQDWPFPREVLQETVDFDLKAFALMI